MFKTTIILFLFAILLLTPSRVFALSQNDIKSKVDSISLESFKKVDNTKKQEIINKLKSDDPTQREAGNIELFELSVKSEYKNYIYNKSSKEDRERLKKYYDETKELRALSARESNNAIINLWSPLTGFVTGTSNVINSLFPDITLALPDVFGRFDHKSTDYQKEVYNSLNPLQNKAFSINGVELINVGKIYNNLLIVIIPLFGLMVLIRYGLTRQYNWQALTKMISEISVFLIMVVLAPSIFSFLVLSNNALSQSIYNLVSNNNQSEACKDDKSMLCAYKLSYENLANSEAIYGKSESIVSSDEDNLKYIQVIFTELMQNFLTLLLYLVSVLVGVASLVFWKGVLLSFLITLMFMCLLLPFSLLFQGWLKNWFNLVLQNLVILTGFSLAYTSTVIIVTKLASIPSHVGYWSISVVFVLMGFLVTRIMPLVSKIFGVNLTFVGNLYGAGKGSFSQVFDKAKSRLRQGNEARKLVTNPKETISKKFKNIFRKKRH